jgi:hypothetical protein
MRPPQKRRSSTTGSTLMRTFDRTFLGLPPPNVFVFGGTEEMIRRRDGSEKGVGGRAGRIDTRRNGRTVPQWSPYSLGRCRLDQVAFHIRSWRFWPPFGPEANTCRLAGAFCHRLSCPAVVFFAPFSLLNNLLRSADPLPLNMLFQQLATSLPSYEEPGCEHWSRPGADSVHDLATRAAPAEILVSK